MVRVTGGRFPMGSDDALSYPEDGEGPVREVTLAAFRIDACAVSNADFAVDLRQWITLDTPGTYVVTASFSAELRPVRRERRATTTADAADVWDLAPSTTAKIVVGP